MANGKLWVTASMSNRLQYQEGEPILPDDSEMSDLANVKKVIDEEFDKMYPPFEPEVIHTLQKDYFLPALKVLSIRNGEFLSPSREAKWENMELRARCFQEPHYNPKYQIVRHPWGDEVAELPYNESPHHKVPHPECECGVYGSVNLEEISGFIADQMNKSIQRTHYMEEIGNGIMASAYTYHAETRSHFALCIVEPSPDADYILCRKGWRASHVFISEIIEETMNSLQAEELLSYAWRRNISLRSIYENW